MATTVAVPSAEPQYSAVVLMVSDGGVFTVTVPTALLVQPFASVPVTVYVVVVEGLTCSGFDVLPVSHRYPFAPLAVRSAVAPKHIVGLATVITGNGFTTTVALATPVHPLPSVPDTT